MHYTTNVYIVCISNIIHAEYIQDVINSYSKYSTEGNTSLENIEILEYVIEELTKFILLKNGLAKINNQHMLGCRKILLNDLSMIYSSIGLYKLPITNITISTTIINNSLHLVVTRSC